MFLILVTYVPFISLALPNWLGMPYDAPPDCFALASIDANRWRLFLSDVALGKIANALHVKDRQ